MPPMSGAGAALMAAVLFGLGTPLAKILLTGASPWLMAGILYLGSGVGLAVLFTIRRVVGRARHGVGLGRGQWLWLAAAIVCGGGIAPVLLMAGLAATPASSASLLLNLESVFTALLAWFVAGEGVDRRIAVGMAAIVAGAAALGWGQPISFTGLAGPLLIAGACLGWAADNNLTAKVSGADPIVIAMVKGLVAGAVNTALALGFGAQVPSATLLAEAGAVGFLGYGVSLVLFVVGLSHIGAARTGAYFAVAPFVGGLASVLLLGEPFSGQLAAAGALMALCVYLHLTEHHEHAHTHDAVTHDHMHAHDEHHRHGHDHGGEEGPHAHVHTHATLRHKHPHYPDMHHIHSH